MMATDLTVEPMTSDQLFKLRPSKSVDRWLFRGELRESKVTKRNPSHSCSTISVGFTLKKWLLTRPMPRGKVYGGEAYFRIRKDPDTNVGIDVAVSTPEQAANTSPAASYVEGPPLLAVEILSPYDKQVEIDETIEEYLECGITMVWILSPRRRTLEIHRLNVAPKLLNIDDEVKDIPEMPGFACLVSELFE